MKRKSRHRIERVEELELLASPVRLELLGAIAALGTCTAAELASTTGRAASSLYFHLDQLVDAGLVLRDEQPTGAGYTVVARQVSVAYRPEDAGMLAAMVRSAGNVLRAAERAVCRALASGRAKVGSRDADTLVLCRRAFLEPADRRELNRHVTAIDKLLQRAGRTRRGKLVMFTACLAPTDPKIQKRGSGEPRG